MATYTFPTYQELLAYQKEIETERARQAQVKKEAELQAAKRYEENANIPR
jgi:hypothetical protein